MTFEEIKEELKREHLAEVFPAVRQKAESVGNWEVAEEVENLWMTYRQMLQFMLNGVNDPQSQQIRKDVCHQLQRAAQRLQRLERLKNNTSEKYVSARKELKNVTSFETLVSQLDMVSTDLTDTKTDELLRDSVRQYRLEMLETTHETTLLHLFNWTWTSELWQNRDVDQANRLIFSDHISSHDKAVFVSAVTLSLFEFIDMSKVLFLLDCYLVEDEQVSQRALVGLVLMLHLFFDQLNGNAELLDRLTILRDDQTFVHDFYSTMMQLQLSCTTDSVTSKMRNDIIPTLMQGQMRFANKNKTAELKELTKNGENPEWMDDAKVDKKMREMAELQLDGADIYYSSFAMLKGYSFFSPIPHWFYPFSYNNFLVPELKQVLSGKFGRFMKLMLNGAPFCNSDKYSLCLTFQKLGTMGEDAVEAQINRQLNGESIDELLDDAEKAKPKKADIRRQYIFDLYRFFYSNPYKQQFTNPFAIMKDTPVTPYSNPWLTMLLGEYEEDMTQYADFLMRKSFYTAALQLFDSLTKNEFEEKYASLWQKIGFCHQKLAHTAEAIKAYTIANSIKPNSKWTLTHLASLCFAEGKATHSTQMMQDAANFYTELLSIEPESMRFLFHTAQALMHMRQFDQALPHLYKAHYLDEKSVSAKLLLAWCLIANGKKDEAAKYVLEVQAEEAQNMEAQLLFACILLVDGKTRDAYNQFRAIQNEDTQAEMAERLQTLADIGMIDPNTEVLFADALTLNID